MKNTSSVSRSHAQATHGWLNEDYIVLALIAALAFVSGYYCALQVNVF